MELLQYALERNRNPLDINNFALYFCFYPLRLGEFQMLFSSARREWEGAKDGGRERRLFCSFSLSLPLFPSHPNTQTPHSLTRTPLADEKVKFQLFFRRRCQRQRKREFSPEEKALKRESKPHRDKWEGRSYLRKGRREGGRPSSC